MRLFISWSGKKSKNVGEIFCDLLPQVINHIVPWFSPQSIEAGSIWDNAINEGLQTDFGLVVLTEENKEKPWILFESGALSKGLDNTRVFTFLVDIAPNDLLNNPLTKFNHTENNKESIFKLITTINKNLGELKLKDIMLEKTFTRIYPELESKINDVLKSKKTVFSKPPSTDEKVNEVLTTVRDIARRLIEVENNINWNITDNLSYKPMKFTNNSRIWQGLENFQHFVNPYKLTQDEIEESTTQNKMMGQGEVKRKIKTIGKK